MLRGAGVTVGSDFQEKINPAAGPLVINRKDSLALIISGLH